MVVRQRGGYQGYKACNLPKPKAPAKKAAAKKAPAKKADAESSAEGSADNTTE
jgi:hypothetical protein